jgi:hypothetical protein
MEGDGGKNIHVAVYNLRETPMKNSGFAGTGGFDRGF